MLLWTCDDQQLESTNPRRLSYLRCFERVSTPDLHIFQCSIKRNMDIICRLMKEGNNITANHLVTVCIGMFVEVLWKTAALHLIRHHSNPTSKLHKAK